MPPNSDDHDASTSIITPYLGKDPNQACLKFERNFIRTQYFTEVTSKILVKKIKVKPMKDAFQIIFYLRYEWLVGKLSP